MEENPGSGGADVSEAMWQVQLAAPGHDKIKLVRAPVPRPRAGQVLVKVLAAPINPRDYFSMLQKDQPYPFTPGIEGCGVVVKSGGGFLANRLIHKRVVFYGIQPISGAKSSKSRPSSSQQPNGTYAEYCLTTAAFCFEVDSAIPTEVAACSIINPISAIGLMDRLQELGAKYAVQTGAASQIARMMIRLAP